MHLTVVALNVMKSTFLVWHERHLQAYLMLFVLLYHLLVVLVVPLCRSSLYIPSHSWALSKYVQQSLIRRAGCPQSAWTAICPCIEEFFIEVASNNSYEMEWYTVFLENSCIFISPVSNWDFINFEAYQGRYRGTGTNYSSFFY